MQLDQVQREAVDRATSSGFAMINGGAGTGKTTIIDTIAREIGRDVELCAFAGKAAARLKEATGKPAGTIHRLLKYNGVGFMAQSLAGFSVIVDEASMIPADLLAEIVKRKPARLILVGDQAQLPPVGRGQPFHDLLELQPNRVTTLTTCYRNSEAVFKAAMSIRSGDMPLNSDTSENERWSISHTGSAEKTHSRILDMIEAGFIDFDQDIILIPRNGENEDTPCSVKGLNRDIAAIVAPRDEDETFLIGDRVINGKNFPEEDVWNGTTGKIESIDSDGCPWIRLDTPIKDWEGGGEKWHVRFDKKMKKHLSLAYALTVHKSQGSQYRNVLFAALKRDAHALLDRSLIYTAVTRTRSGCCVVGQGNALQDGIRTVRHKRTVIQELSKQEGE